ncbi:MAG: hypothetical protein H0U48_09690 [Euzebyaceae bacterium]|nr:hypothetical protein [Euzebyaceae bacterium]
MSATRSPTPAGSPERCSAPRAPTPPSMPSSWRLRSVPGGGVILTGGPGDLEALAGDHPDVVIQSL